MWLCARESNHGKGLGPTGLHAYRLSNLPHASVTTPAKLGPLPVNHLARLREAQVGMAEDHCRKEHSEQRPHGQELDVAEQDIQIKPLSLILNDDARTRG